MTLPVLRRLLRNSVLLPVSLLAMAAQPAGAAVVNNTAPDGDGIVLGAGDTLDNTSTITDSTVTHNPAVSSTTDVTSITNHVGASIKGDGNSAIVIGYAPFASNHVSDHDLTTFVNDGTISATFTTFAAALDVGGDVTNFTNTGTMTALKYDAVYIHGSLLGSFTNSGSITAATDQTVRIVGTTNTFINSNAITNSDGSGVVFDGDVTDFQNNGTITGTGAGVVFNGTVASFTNGGIITGGDFNGVEIRGANGIVITETVVTNEAVIKGKGGLIFQSVVSGVDPGPAVVVNRGSIEGTGGTAVQLTAHNDSLTLGTTSSITGIVDAGGNDNATGDTLTLGGTGAASFAANQIGASKQYRNFENFFKTGTSTWTLTGTNAATMEWYVTGAGSVIADGQMANSYFNMNGGTLAGIGRVGRVTLFNTTIAPGGGAVGTLTTGDLDFGGGSIYDVTVAGSVADKIIVNGTVFLGGTINFSGSIAACGDLSIPILTSNGISGAFTLGTMLSSTSLSVVGDDLVLEFTGSGSGRTFSGHTDTPNQESTAVALDALGCGNQPYSAQINALTDAEVPAAMDALSGEGHAAIAGALIEGSHIIADTVDARIQQAFDALDGTGALSGFADGPMLLGDLSGVTVWGSGYGGFVGRDGDGNAAATHSAASGLVFGADGQVSEDWRLGVLGGLGLTGISSGATSGTSLDASIGGYAGAQLGVVTVKLGAAYTRHLIDTSRSIVFPGVDDVVSASYQAGTAQAFAQFSHDFDVDGLTLTPYARFEAVNHSTDAFTETGGAGQLKTAASVANAFFVTLGLGAEDKFALTDTMLVTARGSLGWRHAFADALVTTNSFAGGGPFSVSAAPIASDVAVISAGLVFDVSDTLNVAVTYDGAIGSGLMAHALKATAAGRF